jgi:sporulation protein YlmC with PRC-barrel domain
MTRARRALPAAPQCRQRRRHCIDAEERLLSAISYFSDIERDELELLYESAVISRDGVRLGTVIDLIRRNGEVVAFEVSGGGMFGSGAGHFRLPVASIVRIDDLAVQVARESRQLG